MFPGRPPRPPRPPYMYPPRPPMGNVHGRPPIPGTFPGHVQEKPKTNVLTLFQTPDGNIDFAKIMNTAQQINKIYGEVSPLISKFFKK